MTTRKMELETNYNEYLLRAIDFAHKAHRKQWRKCTHTPYITHPLGVMQILITCGRDIHVETIFAGILHDTIEDTDITYNDIKEEFGERVANLVQAVTKDPDKNSKEQKLEIIEKLETAEQDVIYLKFADSLHNMQNFLHDISFLEENIWDNFNGGKEAQYQYFKGMLNIFKRKLDKRHFQIWEQTRIDLFGENS